MPHRGRATRNQGQRGRGRHSNAAGQAQASGTDYRMDKAEQSKNRGRGRPTDYQPRFAHFAYCLCLLGATDQQLADAFEVSRSTISQWKTAHREFSDALKTGKARADAEIAHALFQRACGYSHPAVKIFASSDGRPAQQVPYTEHYPPDTTACIFWLKNRQPGLWRDSHRLEHSGPDGKPVQVEEWDAEQIRAELLRRGALPAVEPAR